MCELLRSDFDGMHPTFKQVPPRVPRFSMQATFVLSGKWLYFLSGARVGGRQECHETGRRRGGKETRRQHLEPELRSLDCSDIAAGTSANDCAVKGSGRVGCRSEEADKGQRRGGRGASKRTAVDESKHLS